MCGVVGLVCEKPRPDLGRIAAELLKTLEYRGYDSTGAAIQDADDRVKLVKGVGAPTVMVHKLGIVNMPGRIVCGQVRWATFGAVDDANSQPHVVACKEPMYGAHNGNVTNCDALKQWLTAEGHAVLSDNDGEMVVHTVEHFFGQQLARLPEAARTDPAERRAAMRRAIGAAAVRLQGSFAAVVVDPPSRTAWAIKQGSSLYFGFGRDETGGAFGVASSDLSSVLKLTRVLVALSEGEVVEFDAAGHAVYAIRRSGAGPAELARVERAGVRSRLRADDTTLVPPFETFMEQEIAAQEATLRGLVNLFQGGTEAARVLRPFLAARPPAELRDVAARLEALREETDDARMAGLFHRMVDDSPMRGLLDSIPAAVRAQGTDAPPEALAARLVSSDAGFFADLMHAGRHADDHMAVRLLDVMIESEEQREFDAAVERFARLAAGAARTGGRLLVTCCGTSFHAANIAAAFFDAIARVQLRPVLPGAFRGVGLRSLRDGDLVVALSQSGETKDLIDTMNDVAATGRRVVRIALVNNVNSTLAQEKADLVLPLRCGPETAVPATKSFTNQLGLLYGLALAVARARLDDPGLPAEERAAIARDVEERHANLPRLPALVRATLDATATKVDEAAQMLHLAPSIHLLATRMPGIAMEGALKIREVVLNHAQGYETSEFKHGPNTLLGVNTVFGPAQVDALLRQVGRALDALVSGAAQRGFDAAALRRLVQAATDSVLSPAPGTFSLAPPERALFDAVFDRQALLRAMYADYPLVYVTGPEERDVLLTVSAINTHKIRGSSTVVVAEESAALRGAAARPPADNPGYRWVYVALPRTGDTLLAAFTSSVVLQRLALRMSMLKKTYLDRLGVPDHGVHPDVPKNVSKSITVD